MNRIRTATVCLALLLSSAVTRGDEPTMFEKMDIWFRETARVGYGFERVGFIWENFGMGAKSPPVRATGESIKSRIRGFVHGTAEDQTKDIVPYFLEDEKVYWFWGKQGPTSTKQMFIVLEGDSLKQSVVVYATIENRLCL